MTISYRLQVISYKLQRGFTLLELLVVMSIIGILGFGLMQTLNPIEQIKKSRDSKRKLDLSHMQKALETYYNDTGSYPPHSTVAPLYRIMTGVSPIDWGQQWQPYMASLPKDPSSSQNYVYFSSSNNQVYYMYTSLERGEKDSQACSGGVECPSVAANGIAPNSCGGPCNYAVSSSNVNP